MFALELSVAEFPKIFRSFHDIIQDSPEIQSQELVRADLYLCTEVSVHCDVDRGLT